MIENWNQSIGLLLKSEGGFVNNPADPGGATNLGVTQKTWEKWVGRQSSVKEMMGLTVKDVSPLYKAKYWNACKCDDLPKGIDYLVFDFAVNSGVGRSSKTLQAAMGVFVDGAIGNETLMAARLINSKLLISRFSDVKIDFYRDLPTFPTFGKGWLNRVNEVKNNALAMVG